MALPGGIFNTTDLGFGHARVTAALTIDRSASPHLRCLPPPTGDRHRRCRCHLGRFAALRRASALVLAAPDLSHHDPFGLLFSGLQLQLRLPLHLEQGHLPALKTRQNARSVDPLLTKRSQPLGRISASTPRKGRTGKSFKFLDTRWS